MRGSEWHRWEPHIHGPGTVLNDQFGGGDPWDAYLTQLEVANPPIEVLAVTDYYVTQTYEEVVRRKAAGRLPNVKLIFPNIELRLDVAAKSGFVNVHLLVSPEVPDHLTELQRFLSRLTFPAHSDEFGCTPDELKRLGKAADNTITDDQKALEYGATQFKVSFASLRTAFKANAWAGENILIAVAGAEGDGTSGLRQAADKTIREEIEKFAHVIFASSPSQREFWLGRRIVTVQQLKERYDGCKPCLHGSDAHSLETIGKPVGDRYCWVKGVLQFDSLRQACIEPDGRAFVGGAPPNAATPSQVVSEIQIQDAPWVTTCTLPLNPGLVAIIGARGSGKTALADMIAAGCDAISGSAWGDEFAISPSFLTRARPLIGNGTVRLTWGGAETATRRLDGRDANDGLSFPRARYLSQQFVEELCSSKGASEGLIREIERVIFEAHADDDSDGAVNFEQLRHQRTGRFQLSRQRETENIGLISGRIADELEKEAQITGLTKQCAAKEVVVKGYLADQVKLVVKGSEIQAQRHVEISKATQAMSARVAAHAAQRRAFVALQDEVASTRSSKAPEMLRQTMGRYPSSGLSAEQWDVFMLIYKGNVDKALDSYIDWVDGEITKLSGQPPAPGDPKVALIPTITDLATVPFAVLQAELARLEQLISADSVIRNQYAALGKKIATENAAIRSLRTRHTDAQGASERRKLLQVEREDAYKRLFSAITSEQQTLTDLYEPLTQRLAAADGTLRRLSFNVSRVLDVAAWAAAGEDNLIDCRKAGTFNGKRSLERVALSELKEAWEQGTADQVQTAMKIFVATHWKAFLAHAPYSQAEPQEFRQWLKSFAHWLYGTSHISIRYQIAYDGIDIRKLSPGTRGIVLLLLYLALDDADDRPLIIDQPEENLDPKSVFDELVPLFILAKAKRQVIIVTHNANLVVNTDADQIIVAHSSQAHDGGLPSLTYQAGGLERADIRKLVCDILEGGETAFRERARRLRVRLER